MKKDHNSTKESPSILQFSRVTKAETTVPISSITYHPYLEETYSTTDIEELASRIQMTGGLIHHPRALPPNDEGIYVIIGGRCRIEALKLLGYQEVTLEVIYDLKTEDVPLYLVSDNDYRQKTPLELYNELKFHEQEMPKRQGQKPSNGERYDRREQLSQRMKIHSSVVKDLLTLDKQPDVKHLLASIDGKQTTLSSLATAVRKRDKGPNLENIIPIEELSLDEIPCPCCGIFPTPRIISENGRLQIAA